MNVVYVCQYIFYVLTKLSVDNINHNAKQKAETLFLLYNVFNNSTVYCAQRCLHGVLEYTSDITSLDLGSRQ